MLSEDVFHHDFIKKCGHVVEDVQYKLSSVVKILSFFT